MYKKKRKKDTKKKKVNSSYYKRSNRSRKPLFIFSWLKGLWNLFSDLRLKNRTKRELNAMILIFFSGIVILSLFNTAGVVGNWLKNIVLRTFGSGSFLLPFVFIGVAIRLFLIQDKKHDNDISDKNKDYSIFRLYLGSFLFIAAILGLFHINVPYEEIKTVAEQGENGGYVGFTVNFFLRPLFSSSGSLFVMIFLALFSLQIALEISWKEISLYLYRLFSSKKVEKVKRIVNKPSRKKFIDAKPFEKKEEKSEKEISTANFSIQNIKLPDKNYKLPNVDLLDFEPFAVHIDLDEIIENKIIIKKTFSDFNINVLIGNEAATTGELIFKDKKQIMQGVSVGPTVTQYAFKPNAGTKLAKITALQNDLALSLAAKSLRIEAPIPGKSLVGVEIPNDTRSVVKMRSFFDDDAFKSINSNLRLTLGRNVEGKSIVADLAKMPHLLVAGATGSGKSVCVNSFIISLLYQNSPDTLKFIMVDPKRVELSLYNGIPHLLAPVITDPQKTVAALRWTVTEMDSRYRLFSDKGCKNINDYNAIMPKEDKIPYIVVIIDELADLMMVASKEVEGLICRIAQMARATGIHLILATQRPSVDVITGLIKANIPSRIAFSVSSGVDSKTIIDTVGAERLLGAGDMLYLPSDDNKPRRLQGIFLTPHEIRKVTNYIKSVGEPDYDDDVTDRQNTVKISDGAKIEHNHHQLDLNLNNENRKIPGVDKFGESTDDELMMQAMQIILENKKASASFLQRKLRLGYARASRMIDLLEERGFVGPQDGAKPRTILISEESFQQLRMEK